MNKFRSPSNARNAALRGGVSLIVIRKSPDYFLLVYWISSMTLFE